MSAWNIDYNKHVAESVGDKVKRGKHLSGFTDAEDKLNALSRLLENILFEAEWWGKKCDSAAMHYEYAQKQYAENPQDYSPSHAQEVNSKSPQELSACAAQLKDVADNARLAVNSVKEILSKISRARDAAGDSGQKIAARVSNAVYLMDCYLKVGF